MARILKLQHWKPEFDYNDAAFFLQKGRLYPRTSSSSRAEGARPRLYDLIIVYGGYMKRFRRRKSSLDRGRAAILEDCLKAGTPIFGICLGSQLLARLLAPASTGATRPSSASRDCVSTRRERPIPSRAIGDNAGGFLAIEWHDDAWTSFRRRTPRLERGMAASGIQIRARGPSDPVPYRVHSGAHGLGGRPLRRKRI